MARIAYVEEGTQSSEPFTVELSRVPVSGESFITHNRWYMVLSVIHGNIGYDAFLLVKPIPRAKQAHWVNQNWWFRA